MEMFFISPQKLYNKSHVLNSPSLRTSLVHSIKSICVQKKNRVKINQQIKTKISAYKNTNC